MKLLLVNNKYGSGGMKIYGEQLIKSINKLKSDLEIIYYTENITDIEDFDYILHFGWNQFLYGDFWEGDFTTLVSKDKKKNILFIFFDLGFLNKEIIFDIKNNFSCIIYDSKYSYKKGKKYFKNIKSKVIQPGLSEESLFYYLHSDKYLFLEDGKFNFLHINNSGYIKGIDILLKTFVRYFKYNNGVRLILKINNKVFKYISYNFKNDLDYLILNKKIFIIKEEISQKDLFGLYKISNCYVNTTINETFSLPTLESLFFGLDIISSFELGVKEFIGFRKGVYKLEGRFDLIPEKIWKNNCSSHGFFIDEKSLFLSLDLVIKKYSYNKTMRFDIFEKYNYLKMGKKFLKII